MRVTLYARMVVLSAITMVACSMASVQAFDTPSADTKLYLPFVAKNAPLPEGLEVEAFISDLNGNPEQGIVSGYLNNGSIQPLKAAIIRMALTLRSCFEVDPCTSYPLPSVDIYPAFHVSLPGQPNPFYSGPYLQYKSYHTFENIRLIEVRRPEPDDRTFEPLTLFRVQRHAQGALGVARNDTEHVLENSRVIVYSRGNCGWKEATLDTPTLMPGQESVFRLDRFCRYSEVLAVGQGMVRKETTDQPGSTKP